VALPFRGADQTFAGAVGRHIPNGMQIYSIALFLHFLGLITLFGAFAIYLRTGARLRAATAMEEAHSCLGLLESTNPMFPAGLMLLLASGVVMLITRWRSAQPWIVVGLVGLVAITAIGGVVSSRQLRAIRDAAPADERSISAELERAIANRAPWLVTAALAGGALGIVWVMTIKPGWVGSIAAVTIATVLGAFVESIAARNGRSRTSRSAIARTLV
jgi:hypothetical protein